MIRRVLPFSVVFLALGLLLTSCAAEDEVQRAKIAVNQALEVHADYLAPYEYASAEQYLTEARKQLNESDYITARAYATKAQQMAAEAAAIARKKHAEPMVPWSPSQTTDDFEETAPEATPPPPPPPTDEDPLSPPPPEGDSYLPTPPSDEEGGE